MASAEEILTWKEAHKASVGRTASQFGISEDAVAAMMRDQKRGGQLVELAVVSTPPSPEPHEPPARTRTHAPPPATPEELAAIATRRAKLARAIDYRLDELAKPTSVSDPLQGQQALTLIRLAEAAEMLAASDPHRALDVPPTAAEPAADIAARVASRLRGARKDSATG